MANGKKVRDYVEPADSAAIVDYLVDFFNRPDIPELYSEQVAGTPVKEVPGKFEKEGKTGSYSRIYDIREPNVVKRKYIELDTDKESPGYQGHVMFKAWKDYKTEEHPWLVEKDIWHKRSPRNTLLHEAFGHGLLDAVYGYNKKPHPSRTETFPYMISVLGELLKMKREGVPENDKYYQLHLEAFEELNKMSKRTLNIGD